MPRGRPRKIVMKAPAFGLLYRADDARECYRVWNSKWFGDMFESLSENELEQLQTMCRRFGIPLEEATED